MSETDLSQAQPRAPVATYDDYARERIVRVLTDLVQASNGLTWSGIATAISNWRGVIYHREYLGRLRNGKLSDPLVEIVVSWIEAHHDRNIREKLTSHRIFAEMGISSRDYYFHLPQLNNLEEWDEQLLDGFSGVFLCAPASDSNTYLPTSVLREFYDDKSRFAFSDSGRRTLDIKDYIRERSLLILRNTGRGYFYAAEIPISLLFPRDFVTLDIRMVYEGIAVASSNSIHVQLRECLSRVPKTHSILISPKNRNQLDNPRDISLFLPPGKGKIREDWKMLGVSDLDCLREEFRMAIEADHYLSGSAQISVSPVPYLKNKVEIVYPVNNVYYQKPPDFLRNKSIHFILPHLNNDIEIEKLIKNPLSIGELC